jgi:hypothetical protein
MFISHSDWAILVHLLSKFGNDHSKAKNVHDNNSKETNVLDYTNMCSVVSTSVIPLWKYAWGELFKLLNMHKKNWKKWVYILIFSTYANFQRIYYSDFNFRKISKICFLVVSSLSLGQMEVSETNFHSTEWKFCEVDVHLYPKGIGGVANIPGDSFKWKYTWGELFKLSNLYRKNCKKNECVYFHLINTHNFVRIYYSDFNFKKKSKVNFLRVLTSTRSSGS